MAPRQSIYIIAVLTTLSLFGTGAEAASVVVPNSLASAEGNSNNTAPFGIGFGTQTSMRYQQVYAASQFPIASGPELITQIVFRPDAIWSGGFYSNTLANVRIDLSTTTAGPDLLSTTFANNVGSDDLTVYSGSLVMSTFNTGPFGGPKAFDVTINLQVPFLYNPAAGNLLLDVRNFSGGRAPTLDAVATTGDSVSRVRTTDTDGVNDSTGVADTIGLVTQFQFTPAAVPEPSSLIPFGLGTLGIGLAAVAGLAWRQRKARLAA